jgi:TonB family protein
MRTILPSIALVLIGAGASAQYDSVRVVTTTRVITKSEVPRTVAYDNAMLLQPATFTGGENALADYFTTSLKTMPAVEGAPARGSVEVSFIVEPDGAVNEVRITRGVHPEVDMQVLKAAVAMPNWKPGTERDQAVRARVVRTINFGG